MILLLSTVYLFFFFNDTATTEIYTLSLHDALPISSKQPISTFKAIPGSVPSPDQAHWERHGLVYGTNGEYKLTFEDRKSTRLNSSHGYISYAVFCLKKKKKYLRPLATSSS